MNGEDDEGHTFQCHDHEEDKIGVERCCWHFHKDYLGEDDKKGQYILEGTSNFLWQGLEDDEQGQEEGAVDCSMHYLLLWVVYSCCSCGGSWVFQANDCEDDNDKDLSDDDLTGDECSENHNVLFDDRKWKNGVNDEGWLHDRDDTVECNCNRHMAVESL